jgi:hypothetical protein
MKKIVIMSSILLQLAAMAIAQTPSTTPKALVDYNSFETLVQEVKAHRAKRLVNGDSFTRMTNENGVVILDTRSDSMYKRKHIKGAIHLNFSDFTQENLFRLIPNPDTKLLIYCNNNIALDDANFITKTVKPTIIKRNIKPITLALNIPTYINLYGYGYRNVYELNELIYPNDSRIIFEGTEVK